MFDSMNVWLLRVARVIYTWIDGREDDKAGAGRAEGEDKVADQGREEGYRRED